MKGRIQVIGCKSCTELPPLLDMAALIKTVSEIEPVASAMLVDAACDQKTIKHVVAEARDKEIDRVVVLACRKEEVSPNILKSYKRAGVNEFLVDFVDLRNEVVLPHAGFPEDARKKAEAKAMAAINRITLASPLEKSSEAMRTRNVVIIGGGVAGMRAAEAAAGAGAHTVVVEKSDRSTKAPGVIMPRSRVVGATGYGGNFVLSIGVGDKIEKLECAAIVIATGGGWTKPKGPLAKTCKSAMPLYELNNRVQTGDVPKGRVIIVDSSDPAGKSTKSRDYAWEESLELATVIKKKDPSTDVWIVFQEMRAFGLSELAYREAAELGIRFVRYDSKAVPRIDPKNPTALIVPDSSQGETYTLEFDTLAFASIPPNPDNESLADILRIQMSADGGIRRGSIQRGPVSTPRPGVFVCGSALFPKPSNIAECEGEAAGLLAGLFATSGEFEFGGIVAEVEQEKCSACLTCVRTCPYDAPFIGKASKAEIRLQLCQGCGMCVGICPSKAIELRGYTDEQLSQETRSLLGGVSR